MRIRFWGTRGSLPKPGRATLRYGGNTACVEVRTGSGGLIVLDCGTGAHDLGQHLLETSQRPLRGHLLITHTHWDHIQGFPFFAPLFDAGTEWDIYAPGGLGKRLEETLAGQMEYTYFPVTLEQLGATVRYHDIVEGAFEIDDVYVLARYLNHPALTLGYRLEVGGASLVYAVDHEPHAGHDTEADAEEKTALPVHQEDRRHIEFLAGADLVIHDATYTLEEYGQRVGWGHSPVEYAVDVAVAARARRLALFHHAMSRDDDAMDRIVAGCGERVRARGGDLEVFGAAEGQVIELPERQPRRAGGVDDTARRMTVGGVGPKTVLIVDDAPDVLSVLMRTLQSEGYRLLSADDGESALRIARAERPDLILLDWILPVRDGLEVCRTLRAERDPKLRDVPIVLITAQTEPEHVAAGFAAGATDYLTKPFKVAHVRSRVRGWLLRTSATANGNEASEPP
jgi:CheY-like chemotaxis protein/phosphoribosyl 1,2-cyclic phosphodiesterase